MDRHHLPEMAPLDQLTMTRRPPLPLPGRRRVLATLLATATLPAVAAATDDASRFSRNFDGMQLADQDGRRFSFRALEGRVWRKTVDKSELAGHEQAHTVLSTRLVAGQPVIHVLADQDPGDGFEPVEGGLADLYFSTLSAARRAA